MTTRKTTTLDPVKVCTLALKQVKCASDYHQIGSVNPTGIFNTAWEQLSQEEQQKITDLVNANTQPHPQLIADQMAACGSRIDLETLKSHYGELTIKQAWKLLSQDERDRLTSICQNEPKPPEDVQPMTEQPATYSVEPQPQPIETPAPRRTLFNISNDLQYLNDILNEVGDDSQQQQLVNDWFETLGEERDQKLDSYAALISEMQARADVRKAEARRMQELAATDENRARLLKDRLKSFFQLHDLKTIETPRYKLSLAKNGGKAPLVMDEIVPVTNLPEQFQRVSIDANTAAIREALEAGEVLNFAHLGERGVSMRIK